MPQNVTDIRSNLNDQIANAAKIVGRSKQRQAVFEQICRGKRSIKSIAELVKATGLSRVRVLQEGGRLAQHQLAEKVRNGYKKDPFCAHRYREILSYAKNPRRLRKLPTKVSPHVTGGHVRISFPRAASRAIHVTIDDISSFSKVQKVKSSSTHAGDSKLAEALVKTAFTKILGESGSFKDWGGEKNDLFTTKVTVSGRRRPTVFAFKGKATKGILTLEKMGKRADQVLRLFSDTVAELYLIVFQGQISPVVLEQMKALAVAKALRGQSIYYGVIDSDDLNRLKRAYPSAFKPRR